MWATGRSLRAAKNRRSGEKRMFIRRIATTLLVVSLSASTAQAGGGSLLDVTGTWEGSLTCGLLGVTGETQKVVLPVTVAMVYTGGLVSAELIMDGVATAPSPRGVSAPSPLCGVAAGYSAKPGQGLLNFSAASALLFISKGGIPTFPGEFGLSVKLSEPNAKGLSGKATGSVILDSFASSLLGGGAPVLGSCKVKMQRTSNAVPTIDSELPSICASIFTIVTP
jgi:hypothetical protein